MESNRRQVKGYTSALALSILLTALLFGCALGGGKGAEPPPPGGPVLSVSTTTLEFVIIDSKNPASLEKYFEIRNVGGGELSWHVMDCCPFVHCNPVSDSCGKETDIVKVVLGEFSSSRTGKIIIGSNGGEHEITVNVEVIPLGGAVLSVSPTTLDFEVKWDNAPVKQFIIANNGTEDMIWYVQDYPSFAVCDPEGPGRVDAGGTCEVNVSVVGKVSEGTSGTIRIVSNGGTCEIAVNVTILKLLRGKVTGADTGLPVEGALVSFKSDSSVAASPTDDSGRYEVWVHEEDVFEHDNDTQERFIQVNAAASGYQSFQKRYYGKLSTPLPPPGYVFDIELEPE